MNNVYFMRTNCLLGLHRSICLSHYPEGQYPSSIPKSAFSRPMNLLPVSEVFKLYQELELHTKNPDFLIDSVANFRLEEFGDLGRWMFSGHDLMSSIRKINYGMACMQSGAFWAAISSGSLIKWSYTTSYNMGELGIHDSVRAAILMITVLKTHLGQDFTPMRVFLAGNRENMELYQKTFGCEITWDHNQTEVWFHSKSKLTKYSEKQDAKQTFSLSFDYLDDCLNMPMPGDNTKLVYEIINYACHFGLPTLSRVSQLLGLSTQQFQRRFHQYGHNFSEMCGYVLTNKAVKMLTNSVPVDEVSKELGYNHLDSFTHMFKKHRGVTPKQYVRSLE
ncbi:helix-turn-helix domain-containing protein [Vibrio parahaemolyticus]|uniref:helix-turn-helix domain-containing protein n=1 Tax=Vibrio rotiferianus TaxID=190895 RepID=UPI00406A8557